MSAATEVRRPVPAPARPEVRRHNWRPVRLILPFLVLLALVVVTLVTHAAQQPDPTDRDYLNPASTAPTGGTELAGSLRGQGIQIDTVRHSSDALVEAYRGDATLFVPAPSLMHPYYLRMLKLLPESTQVVLVTPGQRTLDAGLFPVDEVRSRWATRVAEPNCPLPAAAQAGRAGIYGLRYNGIETGQTAHCYGGALVGLRLGRVGVLLAGASDPFRNDRIGEYHNRTLVTGLLRTHQKLIWLDLHQREPQPALIHQPADPAQPAAPPSLGDGGSPDPDFPIEVPPSGAGGGDGAGGGAGGDAPNPLWSAFPGWMWAMVGLSGLVALVFALSLGRRLGPPVSEPLPVLVRAAETVEGRGRLYRRARARGPALEVLRGAARARLLPALDLAPDAAPATVIAAVAARTGRGPDEVEAILYGAAPENDDELVRAAARLDDLMHQTLRDDPDEGANA